MNKYFLIPLFLFVFLCATTKGESLSYYIKKYNLPENTNVLSVFGEDCVNCYYGFSYFLKEHKSDFKKESFVFLFQKTAENEIDNIFKYRLGIEKLGYKIIVDDDFYSLTNKNGVTTLNIIENGVVREQFTSKNISQFKSFAKVDAPISVNNLIPIDTINLMARFGTKKLAVTLLNESKAVIKNKYTSDVYLYDINIKSIIKKLPISTFTEKYDSLLPLLILNNQKNLDYNLQNYKGNEFYKSFPLCSIQEVYCFDNLVYLCLSVAQMEVDTNGHFVHGSQLAMVKLDTNLNIQHVYKIPESIVNSDRRLSFFDCIFVSPETAIVSLSSASSGLGNKDSVCALYSLKTNEIKILELEYESFMPRKDNRGYHNYYHFDVWNENKAYFNRSPFVYNLLNGTKFLIPEIGVDPTTMNINEKDKFFWISKVFSHQNSTFVLMNEKENETTLLQYDKEMKALISRKKITDGYLTDIFVFKNKLFAFENYSVKGDVAVLHTYILK